MGFPRYEKYKDSGVEWLGEVPEHWEFAGLTKYLESLVDYRGRTPTKVDEGILLITARNIKDGKIAYDNSQEFIIPDEYEDVMRRGKPELGDVLFTTEAPLGQVANVDQTGIALAQRIIKFCGIEGILNNYFLKYWIMSKFCQFNLEQLATGSTALGIKGSKIGQVYVCVPEYQEQLGITRFLDRETAKIDDLIAEQQKLIELLKEKRQAVISHAVTKGLNPDAKMKDSGIEWLGEVPEHWDVVSIKHIATIRYGIGEPPKYQPEGIPLIRATNVHAGYLFEENMVFVNPDDIPEKRIVWLESGDIIVVRSGAYTGDSAIIPEDFGKSIAGFDMVLRCNCDRIAAKFMQYALLSKYLKDEQIDLEKIRAAQPHLNAEELGACIVLLPKITEQNDIIAFLDSEITKIDILNSEAQKAITLLQERRTALISAAVTGKIDVRGFVSESESVVAA